MQLLHIIAAIAAAVIFLACIMSRESKSDYVDRKSDDQRKFNQIREMKWWEK